MSADLIQWTVNSTHSVKDAHVFPFNGANLLFFNPSGKGKSQVYNVIDGSVASEWEIKFSIRLRKVASMLFSNRYIISMGGISHQTATKAAVGYDLDANRWRAVPGLRKPRHSAACCQMGDTIFLFGGIDEYNNVLASVEYLHWGTSAWQEMQMLAPRSECCVVQVGHQIFVLGGQRGGNAVGTVERLDVQRYSCEEMPEMKYRRMCFAAVCLYERFIVVLGGKNAVGVVSDIEVFDTERNTWQVAGKMRHPRSDISAHAIDGAVYVFGGGSEALEEMHLPLEDLDDVFFSRGFAESSSRPGPKDEEASKPPPVPDGHAPETLRFIPEACMALKPPVRPKIPESKTVAQRIAALESWVKTVREITKKYEQDLKERQDAVREIYDKQRDLQIQTLKKDGTAWLDGSHHLLEQAEIEIDQKEALLKRCAADKAWLWKLNSDDYEQSPPKELCCPITLVLMKDPVVAADGNTYEKSSLIDWLSKQKNNNKPMSPLTGSPMSSKEFYPNHALKSMCRHFIEQRRRATPRM